MTSCIIQRSELQLKTADRAFLFPGNVNRMNEIPPGREHGKR